MVRLSSFFEHDKKNIADMVVDKLRLLRQAIDNVTAIRPSAANIKAQRILTECSDDIALLMSTEHRSSVSLNVNRRS